MRPVDLQPIGDELAIKWDDGSESYVKLEKLRRHCPCAGCKGEMDIMGNLYKNPDKPLTPAAFELKRLAMVGGGEDVQQGRQYDVAPDGRFLINTELDNATSPITLLMNWNPDGKK